MRLLDEQGRPTAIVAGNVIGFYAEDHYVVFMPQSGDGSRFTWSNGDDKQAFDFLRNEGDFRLFAEAIAITHGLSIKEDWRRPYGPAYVFVKEGE